MSRGRRVWCFRAVSMYFYAEVESMGCVTSAVTAMWHFSPGFLIQYGTIAVLACCPARISVTGLRCVILVRLLAWHPHRTETFQAGMMSCLMSYPQRLSLSGIWLRHIPCSVFEWMRKCA